VPKTVGVLALLELELALAPLVLGLGVVITFLVF
jgi:hypothetical protein